MKTTVTSSDYKISSDYETNMAVKRALATAINKIPLERFNPDLLEAVVSNSADKRRVQMELDALRVQQKHLGEELLRALRQ